MRALIFDGAKLALKEIPVPIRGTGEVLIRVKKAGICSTDLEILRGYIPGFNGVVGHEFFGYVQVADGDTMATECNV